jgi:hypothetical protein
MILLNHGATASLEPGLFFCLMNHAAQIRYPSVGASTYKSYIGHGGTVCDVRFSSDGRRAWSVGGRDCCLFQWNHIAKFPDDFRTPQNDADLL